jgi:putative flippase GtrA
LIEVKLTQIKSLIRSNLKINNLGEMFRFLMSGIANTFITSVIYWFFLGIFKPSISYTISFSIGVLLSFVLNSLTVFRIKLKWSFFYFFLLGYLFQYLIGYLILRVLVKDLLYDPYYSIFGVLTVMIPVNFLFNKFIFSRSKNEKN